MRQGIKLDRDIVRIAIAALMLLWCWAQCTQTVSISSGIRPSIVRLEGGDFCENP